jgi:hypothetical protein
MNEDPIITLPDSAFSQIGPKKYLTKAQLVALGANKHSVAKWIAKAPEDKVTLVKTPSGQNTKAVEINYAIEQLGIEKEKMSQVINLPSVDTGNIWIDKLIEEKDKHIATLEAQLKQERIEHERQLDLKDEIIYEKEHHANDKSAQIVLMGKYIEDMQKAKQIPSNETNLTDGPGPKKRAGFIKWLLG